MKKTKLTTIILTMALVFVFSITPIAASASNSNEAIKIGSTPGVGIIEPPGKGGNPRANSIGDLDGVKIDNIITRWDALTKEQKAELCDSNGRKAALTKELIDKYLEFGIIDKTTADAMKATLDRLAMVTETTSAGGDLTKGRIPGSFVPGHFYWNTSWNTADGVGNIVAMPE
jgi:hypothetical protein